uniref:Uncharacterized protein n=1 Tax=Escherichia coli TaxID=562 RepID=M1EVD5_ECOLX|nr:hypothetical protein M55_082 [Escherichia coli]AJL34866.1 hypothetical protein [Escherichia coli]
MILKKSFSALLHSLPPPLPIALPYRQRTEAHGSDAYTGAESAIALAATIDKMMDFMVFLHISDKRKPARGG